MLLNRPFLKLPIRFDAQALAAEVRALPESAWRPHPTGFAGNEAVRLVTPEGKATDVIRGPMAPTGELLACPYTMEVMGELGGVWGRSRLMGLGPGAEVPAHIDCHYYWLTHLRIHIPVITNADVRFTCGDETVHMAPGECWVFDSFRPHRVHNGGSEQRVHLVLDTVGGERLWDLIHAAEAGTAAEQLLRPGEKRGQPLSYERLNFPAVMSPSDIRWLIGFISGHAVDQPPLDAVLKRLDRFLCGWTAAWTRFGPAGEGLSTYRALIDSVQQDLASLRGDELVLRNGLKLYFALNQLIFTNAIDEARFEESPNSGDAVDVPQAPEPAASPAAVPPTSNHRDLIERPIFVVSPPRSGSTLLFETLSRAPDLYTIGTESHRIIEQIPGLAPRERGFTSNRLDASDALPATVERLARDFYEQLVDRHRRPAEGRVRMLEKTPKNALRVPFLQAIWPDALFVYLYREPRQTLSSMMEAWVSGGFRTYPRLPGWVGQPWSLLLVPGWQDLIGKPQIEIVAYQWAITTRMLLDDLSRLPPEQIVAIDYADLLADPQRTMESLAGQVSVDWDVALERELPMSKTTVSRPVADKWRANERLIESVWPIVEQADAEARAFLARFGKTVRAPSEVPERLAG